MAIEVNTWLLKVKCTTCEGQPVVEAPWHAGQWRNPSLDRDKNGQTNCWTHRNCVSCDNHGSRDAHIVSIYIILYILGCNRCYTVFPVFTYQTYWSQPSQGTPSDLDAHCSWTVPCAVVSPGRGSLIKPGNFQKLTWVKLSLILMVFCIFGFMRFISN